MAVADKLDNALWNYKDLIQSLESRLMSKLSKPISDSIEEVQTPEGNLNVTLSNEIVQLLSDQLYQSPAKAIEELVVNSYDADATECKVYVPGAAETDNRYIIVFDNGTGMDYEGLVDLWHVGRSPKSGPRLSIRLSRKQIGKFGIGKLATYTIANQLSYITRSNDKVLSVTLNFKKFVSDPTGTNVPVTLEVKNLQDWKGFISSQDFNSICNAAHIDARKLLNEEYKTWTIAILENLKNKASKLKLRDLKWVLTTAMPLSSAFHLYLNGEEIVSKKESYDKIVSFTLSDLPSLRLNNLKANTGEEWKIDGNRLVSKSFPQGVSGTVIVTQHSLAGKSDDLLRSNGFFIRVRDRFINQQDALFGIHTPSFAAFNRFRADLSADDLDEIITAPREGVETTNLKVLFQALLVEIYLEARQRYNAYLSKIESRDTRKNESERNYVNQRLVEHPVADVLSTQGHKNEGSDADEDWFYLTLDSNDNVQDVAKQLYSGTNSRGDRKKYKYVYTSLGNSERMVKYDPSNSTFMINEAHDFIRAHSDDGRARALLEDMVTSEALLEIYLRENHVQPHIIGEVLEQRDLLLRSLAEDHPYSFNYIAASIRDAASDERKLEMILVTAVRGLGFVAKHLSNSGKSDGIARFTSYPEEEKKIILEAKSSESVPSLSAIDFGGLYEHVERAGADGCLLLAPSYPGQTEEDNSAAYRAEQLKISCWTVEQLAQVVEATDSRHITAQDVLNIVLNYFKPIDVSLAVTNLLSEPKWDHKSLYKAILQALRDLEGRLIDRPRSVTLIAGEISRIPEFRSVSADSVESSVKNLAAASQKGMIYKDGNLIITVSIEELERRLSGLTGDSGEPRRHGSFRDN